MQAGSLHGVFYAHETSIGAQKDLIIKVAPGYTVGAQHGILVATRNPHILTQRIPCPILNALHRHRGRIRSEFNNMT